VTDCGEVDCFVLTIIKIIIIITIISNKTAGETQSLLVSSAGSGNVYNTDTQNRHTYNSQAQYN